MIYEVSKPRRFIIVFLCSLCSMFIIFVSCSFAFFSVNAASTSLVGLLLDVFGDDILDYSVQQWLDYVDTQEDIRQDIVNKVNDACASYFNSCNIASCVSAGVSGLTAGLLSDELKDKIKQELSQTTTIRDICDYDEGKNISVNLSSNLLSALYSFIKDKFDIFAYADDKVSNVINDFEDFENTDLSILYNLLSTCDTNSCNVLICGKGYFCVMGKNYHNENFSYLGSSSSNTLYYFSPNGYIFCMGSNNGNDIDGYISRDFCYFRMNGLNDICVRRYDKDEKLLNNGYSFNRKNSPKIFSKDGNSYYISEVKGQGYALFDSNDDIVSDYYLTLRECFAYYFLASDVDTFVPSEIDLQYYPSASDATEEKKIVVNNTYNYNTTTEQVYNYDAVGTLATTDKNSSTSSSNSDINITINNNDTTEWDKVGEAIKTWDWSALDISNFSNLLSTVTDYLSVAKQVFLVFPPVVWELVGFGIGFSIILIVTKRG